MSIGPVLFTAPWLLVALVALPLLWLILRAIPPAPIKRLFPGVALLLGLTDEDSVTDRTPWWLLLLRVLALAALILGLAGPILNPSERVTQQKSGPLLIVMDGGWASAPDWDQRIDMVDRILADAARDSRPTALISLSRPTEPIFDTAASLRSRVEAMTPESWAPTAETMAAAADSLPGDRDFETLWISDGVARDGRESLRATLAENGPLTIYQGAAPIVAIAPVQFRDGETRVVLRRAGATASQDFTVQAHGRDPGGVARILSEIDVTFAQGADTAEAALDLPPELRGRLERFQIAGQKGAGMVALTDDSLRRREIALVSDTDDREGLELLSPLHYIERALRPFADLIHGSISDVLPANPDAIVLADIASVSPEDRKALEEWINNGGLLLRFAGPRLAASDVSRRDEDPLMPTRLRQGGRSVGGTMSWGAPKSLAPFPENSPFRGLAIPQDVNVTAQVMAQPDPTLADRVIAQLDDGTPLVTRKKLGLGQIVLFHVTANAEWSSLPLSGLFVDMLQRLAVSTAPQMQNAADLEGTTWQPLQVLTGLGNLKSGDDLPGVPGDKLAFAPLGPRLQPGIYDSGDQSFARNVLMPDETITTVSWPASQRVAGFGLDEEQPLGGWLMAFALGLLMIDILAALALTGRLSGRRTIARASVVLLALALALPNPLSAQDKKVIDAASRVTLGHVLTGNRQVDDTAQAGLFGLSETLFFRTSVEPAEPQPVDLESDELSVYPLLYWPITPDQRRPSPEAYAKLNRYLHAGGMILFDTRDADIASFGASSPNGRKLQQLAAPLDIPPLEPVPSDHVLTRTFYLLQDFPGRYNGRDVWVEAAPADAEKIEGMPFRNLNDNVSPVVIGGNDWASAWAMDKRGQPLFSVGRGLAGDRQREMAYRFGVNLVMHVLTGNYKSDQVHVPALLERLGQ